MYRAEIMAEAERDLEQLDKPIAKRIRKRIQWLADHFEYITPEPLKGPLAGLYKLRVGDYRALYDILHQEQILLVHRVRHRRDVYRAN
ncbi:MAG: type II toxin-antitoxin system RelE/ParE family toxin [Chloroflexi bacterium]|nr:type II toxin-antitoxin system RelE/ParE family toxin [Chloroflexota bacterium]